MDHRPVIHEFHFAGGYVCKS